MSRAVQIAEIVTGAAEGVGLEAYWNIAPEQCGDRYLVFAFRSEPAGLDLAGVQTNRPRETVEYLCYARTADAAALHETNFLNTLGAAAIALGGLETGATDTGYHFARRAVVVTTVSR